MFRVTKYLGDYSSVDESTIRFTMARRDRSPSLLPVSSSKSQRNRQGCPPFDTCRAWRWTRYVVNLSRCGLQRNRKLIQRPMSRCQSSSFVSRCNLWNCTGTDLRRSSESTRFSVRRNHARFVDLLWRLISWLSCDFKMVSRVKAYRKVS